MNRKGFQWTAPWAWSRRTRQVKIGKLINAYIHPSMGGGYHATINGNHLRLTSQKPATNFRTLREAKRAVEDEIIKTVTQAFRQIGK